jgi:hypothetical protein
MEPEIRLPEPNKKAKIFYGLFRNKKYILQIEKNFDKFTGLP